MVDVISRNLTALRVLKMKEWSSNQSWYKEYKEHDQKLPAPPTR